MDRKPLPNHVRFTVLAAAGFRCQYCGRRPPDVELEVDHVFPVYRGGSDERQNLTAACFDCNRGKGTKIVRFSADLLPDRGELPGWVECYDCCPTCLQLTAPVHHEPLRPSGGVDPALSYRFWYRCPRGHTWQTCWLAQLALQMIDAATSENLKALVWPR